MKIFACFTMVSLFTLSALATVVPISSVTTYDYSAPLPEDTSQSTQAYQLVSITVGNTYIPASSLMLGQSQLESGQYANGIETDWSQVTDPAGVDNFDINDLVARDFGSLTPEKQWIITHIGGGTYYENMNGTAPDFLIFAATNQGIIDPVTIQAILPANYLGQPLRIESDNWGDTGKPITDQNQNNGQAIKGIAFSITDLLDPYGAPLQDWVAIKGLIITGNNLDPTHFSAVPEPIQFVLLGLGALGIRHRRK